jgi:hypothetical protein
VQAEKLPWRHAVVCLFVPVVPAFSIISTLATIAVNAVIAGMANTAAMAAIGGNTTIAVDAARVADTPRHDPLSSKTCSAQRQSAISVQRQST